MDLAEKRRLNACFFASLLFLNQFCLVAMETTTTAKKDYELNPEYLGLLYHRASSNTLLHGKAKKELSSLPKTEKVIFDECAVNSKNVLQLAKCVAAVLDARDQLKAFKPKPTDPECVPDESDGNWLMALIRSIYRKWNCRDGVQRSIIEHKIEHNHTINKYPIKTSRLKFTGQPYSEVWLARRNFYSAWRRNRYKIANNSYKLARQKSSLQKSPFRLSHFSIIRRTPIYSTTQQTQIVNKHYRNDRKSQLNKAALLESKSSRLRRLGFIQPLRIEKLSTQQIDQKRVSKRSIRSDISPRCTVPKNVEKLRSVRNQFEKLNHVLKYIYGVTKSNQQFFEKVDTKVEYRERTPAKNSPLQQAREFAEKLETFEDRDIVSILSPKLLNLVPETPIDPGSKRWLSPNMLSFQDEGMLPLPKLLQMSTSDHCETMKWIDLLMDMTGAHKMFHDVDSMFGKFMGEVEESFYPRIKQVEVHDKKFERLQQLTTFEQQRRMDEHGYVLMNEDQLRIAYGKQGIMESPNGTEFSPEIEDLEQTFESEIRLLAKMTEDEFVKAHNAYEKHSRQKRQAKDPLDILLPMTTQKQIGGIRVLNPFAFTTRIRTTIFSPILLTVRVLAPSAFRLMLFSPLALVVWVLAPEAFLAKIFAPKLLDARILSPEAFSFILLSPAAGVLRAGSPNAYNFLVLSPSFGTYQIFSGNRYVVQVLSPGILGVDSHPILREVKSSNGQPMAGLLPNGQNPTQAAIPIQTNQIPLNYG